MCLDRAKFSWTPLMMLMLHFVILLWFILVAHPSPFPEPQRLFVTVQGSAYSSIIYCIQPSTRQDPTHLFLSQTKAEIRCTICFKLLFFF